jgi:hypothetical protein
MVSRAKLTDPTHRATAVTVTDKISDIFLEFLQYDEARKEGHTVDLYLYWFCSMSFIQSALIGGIRSLLLC